ncbi:MAG: 4-hydroxy-tetrahydrodipicolinate reductase [Kiritimatiellae bacterium]|nr:4-hydroxy-tetrahydrodipicolinate reductase [Kiritimatiellia bacterium]
MKVAILGAAGRMGRMLVSLAEERGMEVVAKVDLADGYDRTWEGAEVDAIVDFSFHSAVPGNISKAAEKGIAYVVGTTGLDAAEQAAVDAASAKIPVVQSVNYSLGVNLLLDLVEKAARTLGPGYDIEVVEMHHRHKKDAPSGTALMLAKAAAKGRGVDFASSAVFGRKGETGERTDDEIAIHALRGGSVVGDHTVMFAGEVERVELVHRAQDRRAFAAGALKAAEWAAGRACGLYTMRDVLGL